MNHPLNYRSPQGHTKPDGIGLTAIVLGCLAFAAGAGFAGYALRLLQQSDSPTFSWGPGQYVYNMIVSFCWMAGMLMAIGMLAFFFGLRRLRTPRAIE